MTEIPPRLKKAIKTNTLAIFAGAGTSIYCGLPNWKGLVSDMISDIEQEDGQYSPLLKLLKNDVLGPLEVLDILKEKKQHVYCTLKRVLKVPDEDSLVLHKKLLTLSSKVITSNYDEMFETASGRSSNVIYYNDEFGIWNLKESGNFIFKIHGDIKNPVSCILFNEQYQKLYKQDNPFWHGMHHLLMTHTLLFIGFSLKDPYFNHLMQNLVSIYNGIGNEHYVLTTDQHIVSQEYKPYIKPILLGTQAELLPKIDELISWKSVRNNVPPIICTNLLGRKKEIDSVGTCLIQNKPIVVIYGPSGVGKTTLALEIAHQCIAKRMQANSERFVFNYVIWLGSSELNNSPSILTPVFDTIARLYESEKIANIPANELKTKEQEVFGLLQQNRTLLIIDNFDRIAAKSELYQWLTSAPFTCKILLTTTEPIDDRVPHLELKGLDEANAIKLIQRQTQNPDLASGDINPENIEALLRRFDGNPRILQLAAGLLRNGTINFDALAQHDQNSILEYFLDMVWNQLSDNAKRFLSLFIAFPEQPLLNQNVLQWLCTQLQLNLQEVAQECDAFNLIIISEDRKYYLHNRSKTYVSQHISEQNLQQCKKLFAQYYLDYVQNLVLRRQPDVPYWNALVSDKMMKLAKDWPLINQIMAWTMHNRDCDYILIDFMCTLVHYMDSRSYNRERLTYVEAAIEAANRQQQEPVKALFLIDALGWTYLEELSYEIAHQKINDGLEIAQRIKDVNLIALGNAWLSKVLIEQNKPQEAFATIAKALDLEVKPWIRYRVYMAQGDLYIHEENYRKAMESYQIALKDYESYGGEGRDYQINPRIGLAHLELGNLEEAEKILVKQLNEDIAIGNLYAEYGLAVIEYKRGNITKAERTVKELKQAITGKTISNVLLKMIERFEREFERDGNTFAKPY